MTGVLGLGQVFRVGTSAVFFSLRTSDFLAYGQMFLVLRHVFLGLGQVFLGLGQVSLV